MQRIQLKYYPFLLTALFILTIILAGCGKNRTDKTDTPTARPPGKTISTPETVNKNFYGFIENYTEAGNKKFLSIDSAEYFTGNKAEKEFLIDKKLKRNAGIEAPSAFYIRNLKKDTLKLQLSMNAEIILQTFSFDSTGNFNFNEKSNPKRFTVRLKKSGLNEVKSKLFNFTILGNTIVSVKEIYIP